MTRLQASILYWAFVATVLILVGSTTTGLVLLLVDLGHHPGARCVAAAYPPVYADRIVCHGTLTIEPDGWRTCTCPVEEP